MVSIPPQLSFINLCRPNRTNRGDRDRPLSDVPAKSRSLGIKYGRHRQPTVRSQRRTRLLVSYPFRDMVEGKRIIGPSSFGAKSTEVEELGHPQHETRKEGMAEMIDLLYSMQCANAMTDIW